LEDIPRAHTKMWKNEHLPGNMAVLVNAKRPGLRTFEDVIEASRIDLRLPRLRAGRVAFSSAILTPAMAAVSLTGSGRLRNWQASQ